MARRSVRLYLYGDLPGIGWRYCRAVFGANDKPKPRVPIRSDGTAGMPHYECSVRSVLDEVHPSGAILLRAEIRLLQIGCATMPGRVSPIPARRVQIS